MRFNDAQQALGFLRSQTAYIEPIVYKQRFPEIQYPQLVPVDTSANEWAKSIRFYSQGQFGQAQWINHMSSDVPKADVERTEHEEGVYLAGIGYGYTLEELGQAAMIPGTNLSSDRAEAARRAYEEFVERAVLTGDMRKGWLGLINQTAVTIVQAAATGTGSGTAWATKNGDQIATDINTLLSGIYSESMTVEIADTLLLPIGALTALGSSRMPGAADQTVLAFIKANNVYSNITGRPLTIRAVIGLDTAGEDGGGRMVAYRRDPQVLKVHIPMPHRFLPVWQTGALKFDIPGIFRMAPLEIRLPNAFRYMDSISEPPASDSAS
jgi:hypothetical protein